MSLNMEFSFFLTANCMTMLLLYCSAYLQLIIFFLKSVCGVVHTKVSTYLIEGIIFTVFVKKIITHNYTWVSEFCKVNCGIVKKSSVFI